MFYFNHHSDFFKPRFYFIFLFISIFQLSAQENYQVNTVEYHGNNHFSVSVLALYVETYDVNWFEKFFLGKNKCLFQETVLEADVVRLTRFYQREGYLNVRVNASVANVNREKKSVDVKFDIIEGNPVFIGKTNVAYISNESAFNEITPQHIWQNQAAKLKAHSDVIFRDERVRADQEAMIKAFQQSGYPYIKVNPKIKVHPKRDLADITWEIDSGPQCKFADVVVSGNQHVSAKLIAEQVAFSNGDIFDHRKISETQKRVFNLGVFTVVTAKVVLKNRRDTNVAVQVQVKEAPRLTAKFGVGYGREDRFRTFTDTRRLGFLGGARRANLFLKHSGLEPYHAALDFTQPAFLYPRITLKLSPFARREKEPGFIVNRTGSSIGILYDLFDYTHLDISYAFEQIDLDTTSVTMMNTASLVELYNKSSITVGVSRDNSAPLFFPERGLFSSLVYKISGIGLNSRYHYHRVSGELRQYQKLAKNWVFAWRVKMGSAVSQDTDKFIPVEERFYAGGSNSVRGWARARLGPEDSGGIPIGGNSLLEISGELRYPVYGLVSGVLFSDNGNVWPETYTYRLDELRYSLGMGLRFQTPIGPIRLDAAQPVYDRNKTVQVHISVGQAF